MNFPLSLTALAALCIHMLPWSAQSQALAFLSQKDKMDQLQLSACFPVIVASASQVMVFLGSCFNNKVRAWVVNREFSSADRRLRAAELPEPRHFELGPS